MRNRIASSAAIAIIAIASAALPANATSILPPCDSDSEEFTNCAWDGTTQGNGIGHSYISIDGDITYTACMEGYTLAEDRTCVSNGYWDDVTLHDTDPIDILTEDHVEVVIPVTPAPAPYVAPITVSAPIIAPAPAYESDTPNTHAWALFHAYGAALLPNHDTRVTYVGRNNTGFTPAANQITVWDDAGNHYLFAF